MQRFLSTLALASALIFAPSLSYGSSERVEALEAKGDDEAFTMASMTCQDVYQLFVDADPKAKENQGGDSRELADAQDDLLYLVTWVHGYLSGRDGIGSHGRHLTKAGIEKVIAEMDGVCKPDESKRFMDVVTEIK